MAGMNMTTPLPFGVNRIDNFGCYSQGFVFSRHMAQRLINWYEHKKAGFVDVLTEEYGDAFGNGRWALTSSVIQHVGGKTSKDNGATGPKAPGLNEAKTIWNFNFERFKARDLRQEHDLALNRSN